ncbi:MAG: HIT family protein [Bacteroidales bacterium]|nr:HIT family protein [Bacteroidales bacterium]
MSTLFTKIINGEIPSYKVAENENYYAFLDINPLAKGHTLVVPKLEKDYIFDLDDKTYSGLFLFVKKVAIAIKKAIPCQKVGIAVIGLDVNHVHVHLVPMNESSDLDFSRKKLSLNAMEFEEIANSISEQL